MLKIINFLLLQYLQDSTGQTENYPGEAAWWRDAKFGIFIHWGPQNAGKSGDWYARRLYKLSQPAYKNHLAAYGHPSESGYKIKRGLPLDANIHCPLPTAHCLALAI